jgi:hypothetical protein
MTQFDYVVIGAGSAHIEIPVTIISRYQKWNSRAISRQLRSATSQFCSWLNARGAEMASLLGAYYSDLIIQ